MATLSGCVSDPYGYPSDAYMEGWQQAQSLHIARMQAETARMEADNAEALIVAIRELANMWRHLGLPPDEADQLAYEFTWSAGQAMMNSRAKREGARATIAAAVEAYRGHQYLLANQLLYAATRSGVPE